MVELQDAWERIRSKAGEMSRIGAFPLWTAGDEWVTATFEEGDRGVLPHNGSWMAGCLPSIFWTIAETSSTTADTGPLRQRAAAWSDRLQNRTSITTFASVGHMFLRGALVPLEAHGIESLRPMTEAAARTVADRFQRIGYMKSFGPAEDPEFPFTTIDDVINLCVPLWLAQQTGDEALARRTMRAADLIGDHLVRDDGSAIQVLLMDQHGAVAGVDTYQGYSVEGCWSRGLAWGIYGYAVMYGLSQDPKHLELAQRMADYWIDRVQDDASPIWDFDLPKGEPVIRDTFAGSLGYAGLLELAAWSTPDRARQLRDYTATMMRRLTDDYVLGHDGLGILRGAALDVPHAHGVGDRAAVIVGDDYFVESVWRLGRGDDDTSLLGARAASATRSTASAGAGR